MNLASFIQLMQALAPLQLAEEWDNVGLLLAPPNLDHIDKVLLTIDLTQRVLEEAEDFQAKAIVAYHPPIFAGLKRIVPEDRIGGILLRAIGAGIAIYSPHTALDAVEGGVNDWLCDAFRVATRRAIQPARLAAAPAPAVNGVSEVVGQGRVAELSEAISLGTAIDQLKAHLAVPNLRVAAYPEHERSPSIRSVAVCAGAGGSVLTRVKADLYVTGEMRHHDVLAAVETGTSVVLAEHTGSERGYLHRLSVRLQSSGLEVLVSVRDADPLKPG